MGVRCRDTDTIPKVDDAGKVFSQPDGRRVQLMHNGVRVVADGYYGAWMTQLIEQTKGHHEPQEERVFHEVVSCLPPGGTMIELGGFWAFYSLWFLLAAPGRRATLVEPDPAHIEIGMENFALNGLEGQFIQGFMGNAPGAILPFQTEASGIIEMPCLDVEQIMKSQNIEHLTILHCDTQGAELRVLEQAAALFKARRIDWVFVSTHHHYISGDPLTHQRCLALLRESGATIVVEHEVNESFSGDGLICARFCPAPVGFTPPSISHNRISEALFRHPLYDLAALEPPRLT